MSFRIENNVLIKYQEDRPETEVIIPDGVEIISRQAFFWAKNLEILTIPESVRVIESDAFRACHDLKEIRITEGIENVERYAFQDSWHLDSLKYRDFFLLTSYRYTPAALKMIYQKNCRASVPDFMKYSIIGAMFFYHPEDKKIISEIQKTFRNVYQHLIEENQYQMLEKILYSGKFVNQKNIDELICCAIDSQKYEIQTMLISYKNQYFGYQDITEKLKL